MVDESEQVWLTLAQGHILLGEPEKASNVLLTGSALDCTSWHLWRDLCLLSGHSENYSQMIKSYHRLLNLKPTFVDLDFLKMLAHGVARKCIDCSDSSTGTELREEALPLFERLVQTDKYNGKLWAFYALVTAHAAPLTNEALQQTKDRMNKAISAALTDPLWYTHLKDVTQVLCTSHIIIEVVIECCKYFGKNDTSDYLLQIANVFVTGITENIYEYQRDVITNGVQIYFIPSISSLEQKMQCLRDLQKTKVNAE